MNVPATQAEGVAEPRGAGVKFLYASGARPLPGYTIKRGVGRGGFGEVYYATSDAGKEVALKLVRRNLDVEVRGVTQCLNLKHPHLLSIFDVRTDEQDNCWIIMEYVSGESLDEVIARHPAGLPADEVLHWLRGIAAGVAYLHDHGIVHRDLKPGNIFCDEGVIKLGDYGLSKFISCSRRSGQTESIGTVHYMAPEVANGRYGKEIDIYALGIILYELLTGRVPFEGESVGEVLMKHLTAEPDLAAVPEPFRTVVARALAKDPDVRFRSVEELIAALPAPGGAATGVAPPVTLRPASPRRGLTDAAGAARAAAWGGAAAAGHAVEDDEPILRAVRAQWRQLHDFWTSAKFGTPLKAAIVVGGLWVLSNNAGWMVRVLAAAVVAYAVYRVIRQIVRDKTRSPAPYAARSRALAPTLPTPGPPAGPAGSPVADEILPARAVTEPPAVQRRRMRWRRSSRRAWQLAAKSPRERIAELLGSLVFSAIASAAMALVGYLLIGRAPRPAEFAWLTSVGTLGAWAILIPSKLWEGRTGDAVLRRFVLVVFGIGVGAAAYAANDWLLLHLPLVDLESGQLFSPHYRGQWTRNFYDVTTGQPLVYAYLAYFGFLFGAVRWWRQADPFRPTRLSLWGTAWSVFVAWGLNMVWPFPQPWGFMAIATISIAVQMASLWLPLAERTVRPAAAS